MGNLTEMLQVPRGYLFEFAPQVLMPNSIFLLLVPSVSAIQICVCTHSNAAYAGDNLHASCELAANLERENAFCSGTRMTTKS